MKSWVDVGYGGVQAEGMRDEMTRRSLLLCESEAQGDIRLVLLRAQISTLNHLPP